MTALAYAYQHMASRTLFGALGIARPFQLVRIGQRKVLGWLLLGVIVLGAAQYLGALYGVFSFGLRMQNEYRQIADLQTEVDALELDVQRFAANFPAEHKEFLDNMEKISHVRYVTQDARMVSYAAPRR